MRWKHTVESLHKQAHRSTFVVSWALGFSILFIMLSAGCIRKIDCSDTKTLGCENDEDCSDGNFCNGVEWCDGCLCLAGEPPCAGGCDEETDTCLCSGPADCPDDGLFCNGIEFCNTTAGICGHSGDPCGEYNDCPTCDETGYCIEPCFSDAECDDNNPCTTDRCDDCFCLNQPACPAGCDPQTGACL